MATNNNCELCGEPMPPGEEMFNFHGYSGPCPKPPLVRNIIVECVCKAGHKTRLTYSGMSREFVEGVCGLLDGTSPFYVYPPGDDSPIGKCAWCEPGSLETCGEQFTASIVDTTHAG